MRLITLVMSPKEVYNSIHNPLLICLKWVKKMSEERLAHLEMIIMEQEQTVESLSSSIHRQQLEIQKLHLILQSLENRLENMQPSTMKSAEDEVPPPHY